MGMALWFLLTAAAVILLVVLLNLPWFDEPLLPELEALRKPQPATLDGNAYPFALGFLAAEGRDPRAAGAEIIRGLQASRDRASRRRSARKKNRPSSARRCRLTCSAPSHARKRRRRHG
jgi:hypothetical protein